MFKQVVGVGLCLLKTVHLHEDLATEQVGGSVVLVSRNGLAQERHGSLFVALSLAGLSIEIAHLGTPCPDRLCTLTSLRHLVVVLHHIADTRHPHPDSLVVGLGVSQQAQFVDSVRHLVLMNVSHGEMVVDLQVVPQLQGVGKAGDGVVNLSYLQGSYTVILQGVKLARLGLLLLLFGTFLCRPEYAL